MRSLSDGHLGFGEFGIEGFGQPAAERAVSAGIDCVSKFIRSRLDLIRGVLFAIPNRSCSRSGLASEPFHTRRVLSHLVLCL